MGYNHWYKQREDELKALKCGTKTCGLYSRGRAGLGLSQQAKGQTSSQKGITFTSKFPLVDFQISYLCIFLANVKFVRPTWVQPTLQVSVYRCVNGEVCKCH